MTKFYFFCGNFLIKDEIQCTKIDIHEVNENFQKVSNQRKIILNLIR